MRRVPLILVMALGLLVATPRASAQRCADVQSAAQIAERVEFLESVLEQGQRPSRWWHWGWMSLTFAAFTAQATLAAVSEDSANQVAGVVGAVGPFLAMMTHLNGPLPGIDAIDRVRAMRGSGRAGAYARLRLAEDLLISSERRERWERGWFPITSSVVLPTGTMLFLGLGYEDVMSGLRVSATNLAGGVARIVTYPRWASRGLMAYRERFGEFSCDDDVVSLQERQRVRFTVAPWLGGASLSLSF